MLSILTIAFALAGERLDKADVTPDAAGAAALRAAVAPSFQTLRHMIAHGDVRARLQAEVTMGDLEVAMMTRLRVAAGHDRAAHARVETLVIPWRRASERAFVAAVRTADAQPTLARRDPVLSAMVADARDHLGARELRVIDAQAQLVEARRLERSEAAIVRALDLAKASAYRDDDWLSEDHLWQMEEQARTTEARARREEQQARRVLGR
jgi:hypothetical protein